MKASSNGRSFACTKDELDAKPWEPQFVVEEAEVAKAREELAKAEENGFLYCQPVFVHGEFDSLWVKAHPDNGSKDWGRTDLYRRCIYRNGELVKDPTFPAPAPKKAWVAHGLNCEVRDTRGGYHCGYVEIPESHPWYRKEYNACLQENCTEEWHYSCSLDALIEVHGGVTFSGEGWSGGWWIGFDCAHLGDRASPEYRAKARREYGYDIGDDPSGHYWEVEEVARETERMAEQVAAVGVR